MPKSMMTDNVSLAGSGVTTVTPDGGLMPVSLDGNNTVVVDGVNTIGDVPVSGPLTDTQLRAAAIRVKGEMTDAVSVTGPLTSSQYTTQNGRTRVIYPYGAAQAQATQTAPADGDALLSYTTTFSTTGNDIVVHAASTEAVGAGGLIDLVVRDATDTTDVAILASLPATGGRMHLIAVTTSTGQILRLRKVGNATAATTYKLHLQHIRSE